MKVKDLKVDMIVTIPGIDESLKIKNIYEITGSEYLVVQFYGIEEEATMHRDTEVTVLG